MHSIADLLVNTYHVDIEDIPWTQTRPGMEVRRIYSDPERGISVLQMRAQPWVTTPPHRHEGMVLGITTRGAWSHDPKEYVYKPGSFIAEPNEVHRFFNGPEISEVFFISGPGATIDYDEAGNEVVRKAGPDDALQG